MSNDPLLPLWEKVAAKWGVTDTEAVQHFAPIVQSYRADPMGYRNNIDIFIFNGRYGYCLWLSIKDAGRVYGPCPKFSEPYDTPRLALEAAVARIKNYLAHPYHSQSNVNLKLMQLVEEWADSLIAPQQLKLF